MDSELRDADRHILRFLVSRANEHGIALVSHKEIAGYVGFTRRTSFRHRKTLHEPATHPDRFVTVVTPSERGRKAGEPLCLAYALHIPASHEPHGPPLRSPSPSPASSFAGVTFSRPGAPVASAPPQPPPPAVPSPRPPPAPASGDQRAAILLALRALEERGKVEGFARDAYLDAYLQRAGDVKKSAAAALATVKAVLGRYVEPAAARDVFHSSDQVGRKLWGWVEQQIEPSARASSLQPMGNWRPASQAHLIQPDQPPPPIDPHLIRENLATPLASSAPRPKPVQANAAYEGAARAALALVLALPGPERPEPLSPSPSALEPVLDAARGPPQKLPL